MTSIPVSEILVGVYLGLLAGIFPAFHTPIGSSQRCSGVGTKP